MILQNTEQLKGRLEIICLRICLSWLCFLFVLVIYNVVYISLGSDIKQYGLLRTIGATNRQIKN